MKSLLLKALLISAALGVAACSETGRERPPSVSVSAINAAPSYPELQLVRAQRPEANLEYRQSDSFTFDEDQYTFRIRTSPPDAADPVEIAAFTETVSSGSDYLFVITELNDAIEPLIVVRPSFPPDDADAQFTVVHAAVGTSIVDFYLEPPGADLTAATPIDNMAFLDHSEPRNTSPGEYVVTLTEPANPASVLFTSSTLTLPAGESVAFVLTEGAGAGFADIVVVLQGSTSGQLIDAGITGARMRAINGAVDRLPRDVYLEQPEAVLTTPVIPAVAFGTQSMAVDVESGTLDLTITPEANPSAVEFEAPANVSTGFVHTLLIGGDAGQIQSSLHTENLRPFNDLSRIQFYNLFNGSDALEIFVVQPGTDVSTEFPFAVVSPVSVSGRAIFVPGDYELTMRDFNTSTILFGPQALTLADRGVYSIVTLDNSDGTTADILVIDELN